MAQLPAVLRNNRGQGLVETMALSAALLSAVMMFFALLYFGFVHIGMNYLLHEFLICEATEGTTLCEKQFRQKAQSFLFAAKILTLENRPVRGRQRVRVVLQMPLKRSLTIKKELELP